MHCINENIAYTQAHLSLSKEPGWGVAFYLGKTHVRVYEQSLYLLCAQQQLSTRCMIQVEHLENDVLVYADISLQQFYALLDQAEADYFDSGYGVRWLSDGMSSSFAFNHWREQIIHKTSSTALS